MRIFLGFMVLILVLGIMEEDKWWKVLLYSAFAIISLFSMMKITLK